MPAIRPLVFCLVSACLVLGGAPTRDAVAQVPGVRCMTPVGTCVIPAIPQGSICFCGNFQGVVR